MLRSIWSKNQYLIKNVNKLVLNILSIQMLLMSIQIIPIKSMLKSKALIVFHDIITDMISNKNFTHQSLNFYWSQEILISHVIIWQLYYKTPKHGTLNTTHYFTMKIFNRLKFQQIDINHSLDIASDVKKLYRKWTVNRIHFCPSILLFHHIMLFVFKIIILKFEKLSALSSAKINMINISTLRVKKYCSHNSMG